MKNITRKYKTLSVFMVNIAFLITCGFTNFVVNTPELRQVRDGSYVGEYKSGPVSAKVRITVVNNVITEVKIIEHKNGLGKKAERITNSILEKQSLNIDAVSGATLSSNVILKAVELGLNQGME